MSALPRQPESLDLYIKTLEKPEDHTVDEQVYLRTQAIRERGYEEVRRVILSTELQEGQLTPIDQLTPAQISKIHRDQLEIDLRDPTGKEEHIAKSMWELHRQDPATWTMQLEFLPAESQVSLMETNDTEHNRLYIARPDGALKVHAENFVTADGRPGTEAKIGEEVTIAPHVKITRQQRDYWQTHGFTTDENETFTVLYAFNKAVTTPVHTTVQAPDAGRQENPEMRGGHRPAA